MNVYYSVHHHFSSKMKVVSFHEKSQISLEELLRDSTLGMGQLSWTSRTKALSRQKKVKGTGS